MKTAQGYVIHETATRVVIATGFKSRSTNEKTGGMIQVYILDATQHPLESVARGDDWRQCGSCKHRGTKGKQRTCYVRVGHGPAQVYQAWKRGNYPTWDGKAPIFTGRAVRFGAYGDPAFIPSSIVRAIIAQCDKHTGYTHQWRTSDGRISTRYAHTLQWFQASADTEQERKVAKLAYPSARTLRVITPKESLASAEIACPATPEGGSRVQCEKCGLCNGAGRAKDIVAVAHGAGKIHLETARRNSALVQIGG